jgi:hypothetical protein
VRSDTPKTDTRLPFFNHGFIGVHRCSSVFIGGSKALSPVMNDEQEMAFSPALTVAHRYMVLTLSSVLIRVPPWLTLEQVSAA